MMISGCCNWCGEREPEHFTRLSDKLSWVTWAVVAIVFVGCAVAISFFIGKLI